MTLDELKDKYEGKFIGNVPYFILSIEDADSSGYYEVILKMMFLY